MEDLKREIEKRLKAHPDENLQMAYEEMFLGQKKGKDGTCYPWREIKVMLFRIGDDEVRVDFEKEEMTGPPELIKAIKDGNERYRDIPDPDMDVSYLYRPPGDLWDSYALSPLIFRLFKKKKIHSEVLERYPENPIDKIIEETMGELGVKRY